MSSQSNSNSQSFHILVVDDNKLIQKEVKKALGKFKGSSSFIVDTADNGAEAIEKTKYSSYDIVLMDYQMPDKYGDEVITEILQFRPELKILGFSFDKDPFIIQQMLDAGAMGFVHKNGDVSKLVSAIQQVLQNESK